MNSPISATAAQRVAIVTGGSSGIGRAISVRLGADGWHVAVGYRSGKDAASAVVAEVAELGGTARSFRCDVGDSASVRDFYSAIEVEMGLPYALVNSAGVFPNSMDIADLDDDTLERVLRANLYGPIYSCREFIRARRRAGGQGRVVNISSGAQFCPNPHTAPYGISKAGVGSLTRTLSREVADMQITVNGVAPGFTATEMNEQFRQQPSTAEQIRKSIPLGRAGTVHEIASLVAYIVSDEASYMTGETVVMDGGMIMMWGGLGRQD